MTFACQQYGRVYMSVSVCMSVCVCVYVSIMIRILTAMGYAADGFTSLLVYEDDDFVWRPKEKERREEKQRQRRETEEKQRKRERESGMRNTSIDLVVYIRATLYYIVVSIHRHRNTVSGGYIRRNKNRFTCVGLLRLRRCCVSGTVYTAFWVCVYVCAYLYRIYLLFGQKSWRWEKCFRKVLYYYYDTAYVYVCVYKHERTIIIRIIYVLYRVRSCLPAADGKKNKERRFFS